MLTGQTDVAIVRPPFTADNLELLTIASEPRYVALSEQHPLAHRTSVSFTEIDDEPWIELSESDPIWCTFWRLTALRTRPLRVGASGHSLEDLLEAARTRQAIGVVAESVARAQPWPELTFVKVTDIPPSDIAVAWRANQTTPSVREFVAVVQELVNESEPRTPTSQAAPKPGRR